MAFSYWSTDCDNPSMTWLASPCFSACLSLANFSVFASGVLEWIDTSSCFQNKFQWIMFPSNVGASIFGSFTHFSLSDVEGLLDQSCNKCLICKLRLNKASQRTSFNCNKSSSSFSEYRISWIMSERSNFVLWTCFFNCWCLGQNREPKGRFYSLTKHRFLSTSFSRLCRRSKWPMECAADISAFVMSGVVADVL